MPGLPPSKLGTGNLPLLLYGTAWKEERTSSLTEVALKSGFQGVDTANFPTGYNEDLAGDGIVNALQSGIKRQNLFIQSKYTPVWAHDKDKVPFDPNQDIAGQIKESIQQSFDHLKTDYLDAFFLHAPFEKDEDNLVAWKAFEPYVPDKIRRLGVSNFTLSQLRKLYDAVDIKPMIVQNRFYKDTSYDFGVRSFCHDHGITYQAFWMLTHNPDILDSTLLGSVARRLDIEKEVAFYILVLCLGDVQVLDGTTRSDRMEKDLQAVTAVFGDSEQLKDLAPSVEEFKKLLWKLAGESASF